MIYQIRTYNDLCISKKYFTRLADVKEHVGFVVQATEAYRKSNPNKCGSWKPKVSSREMETSMEMLKIDEVIFPDWANYFGVEMEISPPKIKEEIKTYGD